MLLRRRRVLASAPLAFAAIALGGAAFALYSIGFIFGRVAIAILLFFLTPGELVGGALVLSAGLLEIWRGASQTLPDHRLITFRRR